MPESLQGGGTRKWSILVRNPSILRKLDVFEDSKIVEESTQEPLAPQQSNLSVSAKPVPEPGSAQEAFVQDVEDFRAVKVVAPVTPLSLANLIGVKAFQIISDLMELNVFTPINREITAEQAKQVAAGYGVELEVEIQPISELATESETLPLSPPDVSQSQQPTNSAPSLNTPQKTTQINYVELTTDELAKLGALSYFDRKITISGTVTVMELARILGVQHREIINAGTRLKHFLRGGTIMGPHMIARIAAEKGFSIELQPES